MDSEALYSVKDGEIWEVGPHRFAQGDVMTDDLSSLCGDERFDLIYTDPPWGESIANYFRAVAGKGKADGYPGVILADLYDHLARWYARYSKGDVFVEMGVQWFEILEDAIIRHGGRTLQRFDVLYGPSNRPSTVWWGTFNGSSRAAERGVALDGLSGPRVVEAAFAQAGFSGGTVLDPCVGFGMTARAAINAGMTVYGMELSSDRLSRALINVSKMTGDTPRVV